MVEPCTDCGEEAGLFDGLGAECLKKTDKTPADYEPSLKARIILREAEMKSGKLTQEMLTLARAECAMLPRSAPPGLNKVT